MYDVFSLSCISLVNRIRACARGKWAEEIRRKTVWGGFWSMECCDANAQAARMQSADKRDGSTKIYNKGYIGEDRVADKSAKQCQCFLESLNLVAVL